MQGRHRRYRQIVLSTFAAVLALTSVSIAAADGRYSRSDRAPSIATYINPDLGAATENPNVDPDSNCFSPDQADTQRLSPGSTTSNNVHNDACLFKGYNRDGTPAFFNGPASFESYGVGYINACPDPDGAGPATAMTTDLNGDGRADRCTQSGYQIKGTAGDQEFHARLNNFSTPGTQTVFFCYDPEYNGCRDASIKQFIRIEWQ